MLAYLLAGDLGRLAEPAQLKSEPAPPYCRALLTRHVHLPAGSPRAGGQVWPVAGHAVQFDQIRYQESEPAATCDFRNACCNSHRARACCLIITLRCVVVTRGHPDDDGNQAGPRASAALARLPGEAGGAPWGARPPWPAGPPD